MRPNMSLTAILGLLCLTACDPDRPRVGIVTPDRAQFEPCLAASYEAPTIPEYKAVTVEGQDMIPLALVKQRDKATASFTAEVIYAHRLCRAAVVYADRWSEEMAASSTD